MTKKPCIKLQLTLLNSYVPVFYFLLSTSFAFDSNIDPGNLGKLTLVGNVLKTDFCGVSIKGTFVLNVQE